MARIPQAFIDELISRADVLDVVGARVALKKAGSNYKGLCPFHGEKTPSFTVSAEKGFYHCFGCGAHGTALNFLMEHDSLSFPEAVEALADMLGLEVPSTATAEEPRGELDLIFGVLREVDQIYRRHLREHAPAIDYLKNRGIDGETAARFGIGYAPDAWDTVLGELGAEQVERLIQAGLVIENEQGRRYDRFRDRIMFPIRDPRGRVIGFGGRVLGAGEPKYLNSPETPVFHKGQSLYGLFEARQRPGRPEQIVVVEGYMDVVALSQHGIGPVVATLGTATTTEHIRRLTRISQRVVFCFDADRAGRDAAWRALQTALPYGGGSAEIKFLLLPQGEDPDSYVRSAGAEAFLSRLAAAAPLSRFMIDELSNRVDLTSTDGRARLLALARPLLALLPIGVYRELLLGDLADLAGLDRDRMSQIFDPEVKTPNRPPPRPQAARKTTRLRKTITLILHFPSAAAHLGAVEGLEAVDEPGANLLRQLLEVVRQNPQITLAGLVERFRDDPEGRHLAQLAAEDPLDDAEAAPAVLRDSLHLIVEKYRKRNAVAAVRNHRLGGLKS